MLSPSSNKDGAFSAVVTGFTPVSLDYDMNHEFDNVLCNGTGVVDDGDLVPIIGDCSDADKEVDDIACKLHKLQERRMRMVQQWSESSSGVDGQPISGDHSDCHLSSSTSEEQLHDGRHSSDEDPSKRIDVALLRLRQELVSMMMRNCGRK